MFPQRPRRALPSAIFSAILISGLFAGGVTAKLPDYDGSAVPQPSVVSHGGLVRYDVSFTNTTSGNFQTVDLRADTPNGADLIALIGAPSQGTCDTSGEDLTCSFGFVASGQTITLSVVYRVPTSGSSMTVPFIFSVQGSTGADTPGRSRGDDLPVNGTVALSSDPELGSSYVFGTDLTVQNNQTLSRRNNPQSAKLVFPAAGDGFPASVEEVGAESFSCPADVAATCFGNWNVVSAANGAEFENGFQVVAGYFQVPGNAATKKFVHLLNPGAVNPVLGVDYEIIEDACTFSGDSATPTNMPCIQSVTNSGGNWFYTLVVDDNGPMRGY